VKTITYTLGEIKQERLIVCPDVSLEFFMEHFCKNVLEEGKYTRVEVAVSKTFKFVFSA
jgi:hypothetical protein